MSYQSAKMSILTVNLKHLYQRRGLWLVYAFLGFIAFACIAGALDRPAAGKGQFTRFVLLSPVIGLLAAMLALEVVAKPFSYSLPGHRKTLRQFISVVGVTVSLLGSLLFLMYPGLRSWQLALVPCSTLFAGLIFYWLGVWLIFGIRSSWRFVGFLPLVIITAGFFNLHVIIERAIVETPFAVILVGALSSVVAWRLLGNAGLARRYCAVPWLGFLDFWNRDKLQRYTQAKKAIKWEKLKTHPNPWVEQFFLGRMKECEYFSQGRHVWGGLYTTFAVALSRWRDALSGFLMALLVVCFLGYMGPAATIIFFIMPGFMVAQTRLPAYSSMLVSGGRTERFITTITLVATIAVLVTVLVTVVAASSLPLAAIMPDFTLRGANFSFHAVNMGLFFVPLLMIPIVFALQLIFFRKPIFMMLSIMLLFMLLFFGGFFGLPALVLQRNIVISHAVHKISID